VSQGLVLSQHTAQLHEGSHDEEANLNRAL
jgi:hypothetical protein